MPRPSLGSTRAVFTEARLSMPAFFSLQKEYPTIRNSRRASIPGIAVLTILALAFAPVTGATVPGRNGLIAFHADVDEGVHTNP